MRYLESWREIQTRFIDAPAAAVREADVLVWEVMRERGYPMDDFDQRAADVSVDHPNVVEDYRSAHATAQASERGEATTEDLRQALQHYRALFDELLETPGDEPMAGERQELAADEGVDSREPARSERR
jgi:hypothetical protein